MPRKVKGVRGKGGTFEVALQDINNTIDYFREQIRTTNDAASLIAQKAYDRAYQQLNTKAIGLTVSDAGHTHYPKGGYTHTIDTVNEIKNAMNVWREGNTHKINFFDGVSYGGELYWNIIFTEYGAGLEDSPPPNSLGYFEKQKKTSDGGWFFTEGFDTYYVGESEPISYQYLALENTRENIMRLIKAQVSKTKFRPI